MSRKPIAIVAKGSGMSLSFDALNAKCHYISRILRSYGMDVTVLSGIYFQPGPAPVTVGRYRGIKYFMPSVHRPTGSRLKRAYFKALHIAKVLGFLLHMRTKASRIHFIYDDNSVPLFPFLVFLQLVGVIELIFNIEEWPLAHAIPRASRMRAHCFVSLALKSSSKVVCISSFLAARALEYNRSSRVFRLPALTEFGPETSRPDRSVAGDATRFLYCGNVGYAEVVDLILHAFESVCRARRGEKLELVLILHGNAAQLDRIAEQVARSDFAIRTETSLSQADLFAEYAKASVLLAPLRPTVQDQARFPQKIAEYVALARPILTAPVGDIPLYFRPDESAMFVDDFSVDALARKMEFALDNREKVAAIGQRGQEIGKRHFDYRQYIASLGDFVTS